MKRFRGSTQETQDRRQRVAALYPTTTYDKMAKELGVPRSTIEGDCRALGLRKKAVPRATSVSVVFWDDAHLELLRLMRPVMSLRDIAELLGRAENSVAKKCSALGLKKDAPIKPIKPKAPAVRVLKEAVAKPLPSPKHKGLPPMTAAQRAAHEKTRVAYTQCTARRCAATTCRIAASQQEIDST